MTHRLGAYLAIVSTLGAALALGVVVATWQGSFERPELVALFIVLSLLSERYAIYVFQDGEGEALALSEVFLVVMVLLLQPAEALIGFTIGFGLGELSRRPALAKGIFNIGQNALSASAAILIIHALMPDAVGPRTVAALLLGASVYFLLNTATVAGAISLAESRPVREIIRSELGMRIFVWAGNVSLGLLMGLTLVAHPWALPFAVAPVAMLHLAFGAQMRAKRAQERMNGLFQAAVRSHAFMGVEAVEEAVCHSARGLLRCTMATIRSSPPVDGELGVRLTERGGSREWLVVSGRRGLEPFDDADERLLEAIAAVGSTALENAALYERVAAERRMLADVVAGSSDGIFSLNDDGRVQSWNPAMERIAGVAADAVVGRSLGEVIPLFSTAGDAWAPLPAGPPEPALVEVRVPGDEHRWLSCSCSPLPEGGVVVVARDITAQREVDELKADFLATVSHELRTPLTPIKGFLATLRDRDDRLDSEQRKHVYEVMATQANRLERLVSDLLDATVLDRHEVLFLTEEVDWHETVGRVVDLFEAQAPDREIQVELPRELPAVLADEQRAEQVLSNLLANAMKYSPPGAPIRVVVEPRGGEVLTTVIDQGPGVAPTQRVRIFDRFVRLGEYQTRSSGGAGLGLFIARQLVEAMGGTIAVAEGPEGGAAFSFSLPTASVQAQIPR